MNSLLLAMLGICDQSGRTVFAFMVLGTSDRSDSVGYFVTKLVVLVWYLVFDKGQSGDTGWFSAGVRRGGQGAKLDIVDEVLYWAMGEWPA